MSKHIHKIMINEMKNEEENYTYTYNFAHTKNVTLTVQHNAVCIEVALGKVYDKNELMTKDAYLFPDALRKALLIHIMKFSENITIHTMSVSIDDQQEMVIDTAQGDEKPIYSLVDGKIEPIDDWNDDEIQSILSQTKSAADPRMAALYAYITSKSKHYKAEKFIYLWMALNGMYNYFAGKVASYCNSKKEAGDMLKICCLLKLFKYGNETIYKKAQTKIAQDVGSLLKKNNYKCITKDSLYLGENMELAAKIEEILNKPDSNMKFDITAYGYLLMQFSYYIRCNVIHADKPLALFSYKNDEEMIYLQVVNSLLDEFMEENLHKWFDKKYIVYLEERAKEIADEISNKK